MFFGRNKSKESSSALMLEVSRVLTQAMEIYLGAPIRLTNLKIEASKTKPSEGSDERVIVTSAEGWFESVHIPGNVPRKFECTHFYMERSAGRKGWGPADGTCIIEFGTDTLSYGGVCWKAEQEEVGSRPLITTWRNSASNEYREVIDWNVHIGHDLHDRHTISREAHFGPSDCAA